MSLDFAELPLEVGEICSLFLSRLAYNSGILSIFAKIIIRNQAMEDINRLKIVLVEKKKISKWLSEQLKITPSTVSKWCTNTSQPDIETLIRISKLLGVELEELLNKQFIDKV